MKTVNDVDYIIDDSATKWLWVKQVYIVNPLYERRFIEYIVRNEASNGSPFDVLNDI